MRDHVNFWSRHASVLAALALGLATVAAYHASFSGPFIFDDVPAIVENPTIRSFASAWSPPAGGSPASGRPLVNLSFALNEAISGPRVGSYHLFNLIVHLLAGLTLFGIVRRTWGRIELANSPPTASGEFDGAVATTWFAASIAAVWMLHPIQTEAVTYVAQRAESLAGLLYFLTVYSFVRAVDADRPRGWLALSVVACILGVTAKETVISAPLVVVLYDRTFVAGTFRAAWQRRWRYYVSLTSAWWVLGWLILGSSNRGGTAGFGLQVTPWAYLLTQGQAIVRYLGLAVWPHPQVFDYGVYLARTPSATGPFVTLVALLAVGTIVALRRNPVVGFLGAWFFLILAPSSSIIPVVTQTIAEHRMYLPLAAVIVAAAVSLRRLIGQRSARILMALALALGGLTARRNQVYSSALRLWTETVARRPENSRARYNLALELLDSGRSAEAVQQVGEAVRRHPESPEAQHNLALVLLRLGRAGEAIAPSEEVLRLFPGFVDGHLTLGNALLQSNRLPEAIAQFERARQLRPQSPDALNNLGGALLKAGRSTDALAAFSGSIRLEPNNATVHANLGDAFRQLGQFDQSLAEFHEAMRLKPGSAEVYYGVGSTLVSAGRLTEGIPPLQEAIRLKAGFLEAELLLGGTWLRMGRTEEGLGRLTDTLRTSPDSAEAHFYYANALLQLGRAPEAIEHYQAAVRLQPNLTKAHANLAYAWVAQNRWDEAIREFQAALQLDPNQADFHFNLGRAWLESGHAAAAVGEFQEALRLNPSDTAARENLNQAQAAAQGRE